MKTTPVTTARMRQVGQLAAYLPHLVGFEPHESLVAVGLIDHQVGLTARVDIPEADDEVAPLARHVASALVRGGHTEAIIFAVADGRDPTALVAALRRRLHAFCVPVRHTAWLDGHGAWRATACWCGACPRHWTPLPDISTHPAVLQHLTEGRMPAADRAAIAGRLATDEQAAQRVADAVEAARRGISTSHVARAVATVLYADRPVEQLPASTLATAGAALQDVLVRDALLQWLLPDLYGDIKDNDATGNDVIDALGADLIEAEAQAVRRAGVEQLDRAPEDVTDRVLAWARCMPTPLAPAVLTVLAALLWHRGGGVLGLSALERAMDIDPDYRLAMLLWQAYTSGVRPTLREPRRSA